MCWCAAAADDIIPQDIPKSIKDLHVYRDSYTQESKFLDYTFFFSFLRARAHVQVLLPKKERSVVALETAHHTRSLEASMKAYRYSTILENHSI